MLVQCLILGLPLLVMVTTHVLWVPILLTLETIPVRSIPWLCVGGITNIIGLFLLINVTGLRPSLLVVKFLAKAQVTLPNPNVFLTVIGQLIRWFRNRKDPVLITRVVVLRMAPARALRIYRTP